MKRIATKPAWRCRNDNHGRAVRNLRQVFQTFAKSNQRSRVVGEKPKPRSVHGLPEGKPRSMFDRTQCFHCARTPWQQGSRM